MDLRDLIWPARCIVCGAAATAFCPGCRLGVAPVDAFALGACEVRVAGAHDGALRRAVLAFKGGRRDVGVALADFTADRARASLAPGALIVPIPTAARRAARRGFDQGAVLGRELARHAGLDTCAALVRVGRDTQHGRDRGARLAARGRFAVATSSTVRRALAGRAVVLVDDVVTTGASLRDATATLAEVGARVVAAVAIARAFPAPIAEAAREHGGLGARSASHTVPTSGDNVCRKPSGTTS